MGLQDVTAAAKAEIETLQQDFADAMRGLENIGKRIENAYASISSLHKQATNESKPNPEVNAVAGGQPQATPLPPNTP